MRILSDVDGDEVSLVKRAANKRRFLLLKGDASMDSELEDILAVPWEREGALLDELRKEAVDETTEKALIAGIRLLKAVEAEVSPELVEKLGREMYPVQNNPLNTGKVKSPGQLSGSSSAPTDYGTTGSADDGELCDDSDMAAPSLTGSGSAPKVAAENDDYDNDTDDNDDDEDDAPSKKVSKRDFSAQARRDSASRGHAMPDGSFPIENKSDLKNAIGLAGNAKNPGKARAFIRSRAKAMGATSMLPDSWGVSKSDNDDNEGGTVEFRVPVQKEDGTWDYSDVPEESRGFFEQMIQKADKADRIEKSLDETREELRKSQDELRQRDYIEKAESYGALAPADKLGLVLKNAAETMDAERYAELEQVLASAQARVSTGDLFKELGSRALEDEDSMVAKSDPWSQIEHLAEKLVEKSGELTQEQAIDKVLQTAEGKSLYARYEHGYLPGAAAAAGFGGVN